MDLLTCINSNILKNPKFPFSLTIFWLWTWFLATCYVMLDWKFNSLPYGPWCLKVEWSRVIAKRQHASILALLRRQLAYFGVWGFILSIFLHAVSHIVSTQITTAKNNQLIYIIQQLNRLKSLTFCTLCFQKWFLMISILKLQNYEESFSFAFIQNLCDFYIKTRHKDKKVKHFK